MSGKTYIERPDFHLKIVQEISDLVNQSQGLDTILRGVVQKIADSLHFDVVSIYLWSETENKLVLRSTKGLYLDPENPIKLSPGEGLTGVVYREKRPLFAMPASHHPAYKYFPESGEKAYECYFGVPILLHNSCLGVLVGQTTEKRYINPAEQTLFHIIASRLAGVLEVADRLERLKPVSEGRRYSAVYQGKGVSGGFAVGQVYLLRGLFRESPMDEMKPLREGEEDVRLLLAIEKVEEGLTELIDRLRREGILSDAEINIFESHLMILKSSTFRSTLLEIASSKGYSAEAAVIEGIESIASHFEKLEDRYLVERAQDFRDIGEKILEQLLKERGEGLSTPNPHNGAIVVATDIGPSFITTLLKGDIKAIVTEKGGETSHMSILAKSLGIPAVYGIENVVKLLKSGQTVLVDGKTGFVFVNPDKELIREYETTYKKHAKLLKLIEAEVTTASPPSIEVEITANIGFPVDVEMAKQYKIRDVGLYRTEFAFTLCDTWPSVKEQVEIYKNVAKNFEGYITVRTLDVGADKPLPYFKFPEEVNPLLGLRAIRFSMEYLDLFRDQLRAIMLAIKEGYKFRILLPLVTHIWEVETAHEIIEEISEEIELPYADIPPLGIMMEVPALVYQLFDYKDLIDFVSIGTNDLIQYILAVDRNSNLVGHLYSSFHPSVIRILSDIFVKTQALGKEVTICGEMAGTPRGALALLALGYRKLSVLPARAPLIRHLVSRIDEELLQNIGYTILREKSATEIDRYLRETLTMIDPTLSEFD